MADIKQIQIGNTAYNIYDTTARTTANKSLNWLNNYARYRVLLSYNNLISTYDAPSTSTVLPGNDAGKSKAFYGGGYKLDFKEWKRYVYNNNSATPTPKDGSNLLSIPNKENVNSVLVIGHWYAHYRARSAGNILFGIKYQTGGTDPAEAPSKTDMEPSATMRCRLYSPASEYYIENTGPISLLFDKTAIQTNTVHYFRHCCGGPTANMAAIEYVGLVARFIVFGGYDEI